MILSRLRSVSRTREPSVSQILQLRFCFLGTFGRIVLIHGLIEHAHIGMKHRATCAAQVRSHWVLKVVAVEAVAMNVPLQPDGEAPVT
jgi:hypothetical protein